MKKHNVWGHRTYEVVAAINDLNDYDGHGTEYRLEGERWERLKDIPQAISPEDI